MNAKCFYLLPYLIALRALSLYNRWPFSYLVHVVFSVMSLQLEQWSDYIVQGARDIQFITARSKYESQMWMPCCFLEQATLPSYFIFSGFRYQVEIHWKLNQWTNYYGLISQVVSSNRLNTVNSAEVTWNGGLSIWLVSLNPIEDPLWFHWAKNFTHIS